LIDFDKVIGITVDYTYEIFETSSNYNSTTTERLVNTNADVWAATIPEFSIAIVPLLSMIAVSLMLIAKKKPRKL
jgi:hypothetical protein